MSRALTTLAILLTLSSCGGEPAVDWSKYPDGAKGLIASDVKAKDCQALQDKFDTFDKAGDSADLITYIDWQMGNAGCH